MSYLFTIYKIHKKEINVNLIIIFLGFLFIILPLIIYRNITEPISVIFVGIGCSVIATGLTVLLTLLYKDSDNRFYEYLSKIGLSDILFEEDLYECLPQRILSSQNLIYYSTNGCPLAFVKNNLDFFQQAINNNVNIRFLFGISTSNRKFERHGGDVYKELLALLSDLEIECREVDFAVNQTLIIDEKVWDVHSEMRTYPVRVMEYKKNNNHSSFYNYRYDIFCKEWDVGEMI